MFSSSLFIIVFIIWLCFFGCVSVVVNGISICVIIENRLVIVVFIISQINVWFIVFIISLVVDNSDIIMINCCCLNMLFSGISSIMFRLQFNCVVVISILVCLNDILNLLVMVCSSGWVQQLLVIVMFVVKVISSICQWFRGVWILVVMWFLDFRGMLVFVFLCDDGNEQLLFNVFENEMGSGDVGVNFKQFEFCVVLVEECSFIWVVVCCYVVQFVFSYQIVYFEEELQVILFECLLCQVWVILAGEVLFIYVCQVFDVLCYLCEDVVVVVGQVCGMFIIGQIILFIVVDLVVCFVVFYMCYLQVEFCLCMDRSEVLMDDVCECCVDVVLVGLLLGIVIDGVCYCLLVEELMVVVLLFVYLLVNCRWLLLVVLVELLLVDFQYGSGVCWQIDEVFVVVGLLYWVLFEINYMLLIECFVQQGLVVGIVFVQIVVGFIGVVCVVIQDVLVWCVYVVWLKLFILVVWVFMDELLQYVVLQVELCIGVGFRCCVCVGLGF